MAKKAKEEQEERLEKKLWKTADKLRKNKDAAEYKHIFLGLIFLNTSPMYLGWGRDFCILLDGDKAGHKASLAYLKSFGLEVKDKNNFFYKY